MQGLEGPDHRLHEREVERLVIVVEVDPARLPGDVLLPLLGVAEHRVACRLVEGRDAHLLDLALVGDTELAFGLEFGGEAVSVPAEAAMHLMAAHGLEAREEVLRVPREEVPVVRQAVGEGRPVVEDPFRRSLALVDRGLEGAVLLPELEDLALDGREVGRGCDAVVVWGAGVHARSLRGRMLSRGRRPPDRAPPRYHLACPSGGRAAASAAYRDADGPLVPAVTGHPFGSTEPVVVPFAASRLIGPPPAVLPKTPR